MAGLPMAAHAQGSLSAGSRYTVPADVAAVQFTVTGAGGGPGGRDAGNVGGAGGRGTSVTGRILVTAGQVFTADLAGGGHRGVIARCAGAGAKGAGWVSGGDGSAAGCSASTGQSGGGGGGGGATAILLDGVPIAVASGGGGGEGGSARRRGLAGWASTISSAYTTTGSPGHVGFTPTGGTSTLANDGSGGGGGGGGCIGGAGGVGTLDQAISQVGPAAEAGTSCVSPGVLDVVIAASGGLGGVPETSDGGSGSVTLTAIFEPRVSIRTTTLTGSGTARFAYTLTGLSGTGETIAVPSPGFRDSATVYTGSVATTVTLRQATLSAGWPFGFAAYSCVDMQTATSGNPPGNLATSSEATVTLPAAVMRPGADIRCTFDNEALPPPSTGASGVRVPQDRQLADGVAQNRLEALVRNAAGASVPGQTVVFGATAGVDLGRGAGLDASCVTDAAGSCSVSATSALAASYSTPATIDGVALTGSFTVAGNVYQASPLSYRFVMPAQEVTMAIVPTSIVPGGISLLTITLTNPNARPVTGAAFTNTYPAGLVNGAVPGAATTCAGGIVSTPTSGSLRLAGATVPAKTSCSVTVRLTSSTLGLYVDTLPAGTVTATDAADSRAAASASLTVAARALVRVQKITTDGVGGNFTFTQSNLDSVPAPIQTLALHTATPAAPAAHTVTAIRTAVTLAESMSDNFMLTGAQCRDANASLTGNPATFGTLAVKLLTLPASVVLPGADIYCVFSSAYRPGISGRFFVDTGVGGGRANNGIADGGEPGLAGQAVGLSDCDGTIHAHAVTDSAGHYTLSLPLATPAGARLCLDTTHSAGRQSTGASAGGVALPAGNAVTVGAVGYTYIRGSATDRIALLWPGSGGAGIVEVNFASVPRGSLVQGGVKIGRPGSAVTYGHIFTAGTAGTLSLSVGTAVSTPHTPGWSQQIFADTGCIGELQPGAARLYPPATAVPVTAGQVICMVLRESIPSLAPIGSRNVATLQAAFDFANASPALAVNYLLDDVTTVSGGAVELSKEVRNVTQGATAFGVSNTARPGETLEYRIRYSNQSSASVKQLAINDATPAYTRFVSALPETTPATLTACSKTTPTATAAVACGALDAAGGQGAMQWSFTGDLTPGATGSLLFRVVVD